MLDEKVEFYWALAKSTVVMAAGVCSLAWAFVRAAGGLQHMAKDGNTMAVSVFP